MQKWTRPMTSWLTTLLVLASIASSPTAAQKTDLDLDRAKALGALLEKCQGDHKRDVAACEEKAALRLATAEQAAEIRLQGALRAGARRLAGCREELAETDKALTAVEELAIRRWYEAPSLWFWTGMAAGTVAGLTLAIASVWGVSQLTAQPLRPAIE